MATMNAVAFGAKKATNFTRVFPNPIGRKKKDNYWKRIISQRWSKDEGKQEIAAAVVVRKNLKSMKEKGF